MLTSLPFEVSGPAAPRADAMSPAMPRQRPYAGPAHTSSVPEVTHATSALGPYRAGRSGAIGRAWAPTAAAEAATDQTSGEASRGVTNVSTADAMVAGGTLPWIDQFLATTPAAPVAAICLDKEPGAGAHEAAAVEAPPEGSTPVASASDVAAATATTEPGEESWPLSEATARLEALRPALVKPPEHAARPDELFADPGTPEPLAPWGDDDLIDIMPTLGSARLRPVTPPYPGPRTTPAHPTPVVSGAPAQGEAVARALEALAQRVRSGDLALPGYDVALGDTAVLVAALAALHGVR